MRAKTRFGMTLAALMAVMSAMASPASAQSDIVFAPGVGTGEPATSVLTSRPAPVSNAALSCADFASSRERMDQLYRPFAVPIAVPSLAEGVEPRQLSPNRLDKTLLDTALDSYNRNICRKPSDRGFGPSHIVIVDYAKPSSQPRLYAVDLVSGQGLDTPVAVAHGVGSDRDDDGVAERFSNVYNSLASSLGAARGGELYTGINGLSLRLDGLDQSNSGMRLRDIVAHSYAPERRRYFNSSLIAVRGGKPGMSEGCFVVAPHLREWLFGILRDGGFLYAGLGGDRAKEMPGPVIWSEAVVGDVQFVRGTGG
jgi:L,D-transpeptidase catalytic domain